MKGSKNRRLNRIRKKKGVRLKISGDKDGLRLTVFRSLRHIYVQAIDDTNGATIASSSTMDPAVKKKLKGSSSNIEAAKAVGQQIGEMLSKLESTNVVFDRNGYLYHGRIKALADSAREAGLIF